ncbi:suppressor of fused domain protein [Actinoplanes sp. NPDC049802]|uniref:suppressor of fused domain protein n=1 Tax=Actinoplanes sp. NPDC049802 TaxID=3154742 RepID=UPI0033DE2539
MPVGCDRNGQDVAIVWLVPVTSGEAKFIADYGRQRFEQLLSEQDPDLMDGDRPSIA